MSLANALLDATDRFLAETRWYRRMPALSKARRELERDIARAFLRQGREFLRLFAQLRDRWPVQEAAIPYTPPPDWEQYWEEVALGTRDPFLTPLIRAARIAMTLGGRELIRDMALDMAFNLDHPLAVSYLQEFGAKLVRTNETTRRYIRTLLTDGLERGWSYDKMARAISDRFVEFAVGRPQEHIDSRAHLVAVTEVGNAYEHGNRVVAVSLREMGLDMEKSWLTVGDERVCSEACEANQAQGWIHIDEPFQSGHMQPLAHPACRCTTLYRRRVEGR